MTLFLSATSFAGFSKSIEKIKPRTISLFPQNTIHIIKMRYHYEPLNERPFEHHSKVVRLAFKWTSGTASFKKNGERHYLPPQHILLYMTYPTTIFTIFFGTMITFFTVLPSRYFCEFSCAKTVASISFTGISAGNSSMKRVLPLNDTG